MVRRATHGIQAARVMAFAAALLETACSIPAAAGQPDASAAASAPASHAPLCAASDSDVPTFRGDAARTGRMPGPLPLTTPAMAWRLEAGAPLHNSPAVVAGTGFEATETGALWAVDLATGARRWRADLDGVLTSPTVIADLVVVGSTTGSLTALDRATGSIRWTLDLPGQVRAAPAPVEGGVIAGSTTGQVT